MECNERNNSSKVAIELGLSSKSSPPPMKVTSLCRTRVVVGQGIGEGCTMTRDREERDLKGMGPRHEGSRQVVHRDRCSSTATLGGQRNAIGELCDSSTGDEAGP